MRLGFGPGKRPPMPPMQNNINWGLDDEEENVAGAAQSSPVAQRDRAVAAAKEESQRKTQAQKAQEIAKDKSEQASYQAANMGAAYNPQTGAVEDVAPGGAGDIDGDGQSNTLEELNADVGAFEEANPLPPGMSVSGSQAAQTPPGASDLESMIEEFLKGQFGASDDTAEEEALMKQQQQDMLFTQLREQRARAGRAGMGMSGAFAALEGDVRRQAAQDLASQMFGAREREQEQAYNRGLGAIGADVDMQRVAQERAADEARILLLKEMMGEDADGADIKDNFSPVDGSGGSPGKTTGQSSGGTSGKSDAGVGSETYWKNRSSKQLSTKEMAEIYSNGRPQRLASEADLPKGAVPLGQGAGEYYYTANGQTYVIKPTRSGKVSEDGSVSSFNTNG